MVLFIYFRGVSTLEAYSKRKMTKNLFRVRLKDPRNEQEHIISRVMERLDETDEALRSHLPVHVLEMQFEDVINPRYFLCARDMITEWGNILFVNQELISQRPFKRLLDTLGYKRRVIKNNSYSEGGLFIFSNDFTLISDRVKSHRKTLRDLSTLLNMPTRIHFLPTFTCSGPEHVDCDYAVIDSAKLIYTSDNVEQESNKGNGLAKRQITKIASRNGFTLRPFKFPENLKFWGVSDLEISPGSKTSFVLTPKFGDDKFADQLRILAGINLITSGNKILTAYIHDQEIEYLRTRSVEAIQVPLPYVEASSGLRCVYAEFNL